MSNYSCKATVTLADETVLTLNHTNFTVGNNTLYDSAGQTGLPLGVAVAKVVQLSISNADGEFDDYDFFGAQILLSAFDGANEISEGRYTVTSPAKPGSTITITATDDMYKADKPARGSAFSALVYPCTLRDVFHALNTDCGFTAVTEQFINSSYVVKQAPQGDYTYRQLLGFVAQIAGGNARISKSGQIEIITYDFSFPSGTPNISNWIPPLNLDTDDITITGVKTTYTRVVDDEEVTTTLLNGSEGYVLEITNPLIYLNEQAALNALYNDDTGLGVFNDATFRKFDGAIPSNAGFEFMDSIKITDRRGNVYQSVISDIEFSFLGITRIDNSAEDAIKAGATYVTPSSEAIRKARDLFQREKTSREAAVEALNERMTNAGGMYVYQQTVAGATTYYLHDKPDEPNASGVFPQSRNVIKVTSEGIGFSTDGGSHYLTGIGINGDWIAGILTAEGISADWINTGALEVLDDHENLLFRVDKDTGEVYIAAEKVKIQSQDIPSLTIKTVAVYYALSDSSTVAPSSGWSTVAPAWVDGKFMWQKTVTTKADGTQSESAPTCISGATGASGSPGTPGEDGEDGKDGVGIRSVSIAYGESASSSIIPTTWSPTMISVADGHYLWTRTITDYTDDDMQDTVSYTYSRQGEDGEAGTPGTSGRGISSTSVQYQAGTSGTTAPTGTWSNTVPTVSAGQYLWTRTIITYTDNTTSTSYSVSQKAVGISSVRAQYYLSTSSTTQTGGSWSYNVPAWVSGKYIWTRSYITWADGTTSTTTPVLDNASNDLGAKYSEIKQTTDAIELTLKGDGTTGFVFSTAGLQIYNNGTVKMTLSKNGKLTATGADVSGTITAEAGKIGNFTIENGSLHAAPASGVGPELVLGNGGINITWGPTSFGYFGAVNNSYGELYLIADGSDCTIQGGNVRLWGGSLAIDSGSETVSFEDSVLANVTADGRGVLALKNKGGYTAVKMYGLNSGQGEIDLLYNGSTRAALYISTDGEGCLRLYNSSGQYKTLTYSNIP